jgi:hypothetical protein
LHALLSHPALVLEAVVLAAAAVAIPYVARRGLWWIAGLGAALMATALLPEPTVVAVPLVLTTWATCIVLAVKARS